MFTTDRFLRWFNLNKVLLITYLRLDFNYILTYCLVMIWFTTKRRLGTNILC